MSEVIAPMVLIVMILLVGFFIGIMQGVSDGKRELITNYCTADKTTTLAARDECIEDMQQYK